MPGGKGASVGRCRWQACCNTKVQQSLGQAALPATEARAELASKVTAQLALHDVICKSITMLALPAQAQCGAGGRASCAPGSAGPGHARKAPQASKAPGCRQRRTLQLTPVAYPGHISANGKTPVCCRFAAGRGMGPTFEQLFTCAVEALHDPELPVSPTGVAYRTEFEVLGMASMGTQVLMFGLVHVQCPGPSGPRPMPGHFCACTVQHCRVLGGKAIASMAGHVTAGGSASRP